MQDVHSKRKRKHQAQDATLQNVKLQALQKNSLESIVDYTPTPEEKHALWLKSKEDTNKSNYLEVYNALPSLKSKDKSSIIFIIDRGANVNIE